MEKEIQKILDEMLKTFISKNSDYGNSFEEVRKEFKPYPVILIRLSDKFKRVKTLLLKTYSEKQQGIWLGKNADEHYKQLKVKDETIEDTLIDLANYCVMEVALSRLDKNE